MSERLMLTYGYPDQGVIVAGGDAYDRMSFLDYDVARGRAEVSFSCTLALKNNTAYSPAITIADQLEALNIQRGNLAISTTTASKTLVVTATQISGNLVRLDYVSGDAPDLDDIGLVVMGDLSPLPIVGFDSTSPSIYVYLHPSQATFFPPFGNQNITISTLLHRCIHGRLDGDEGAVGAPVIVPMVVGGMDARVSATRIKSPENTTERQLVDFNASFTLPAEEAFKDDDNRMYVRSSRITRTLDQAQLQTVNFSADITAGNVSGAATLYPEIIDSFWDTWTQAILDTLSTGQSWDKSARIDSFDEAQRLGSSSQSFREMAFPDLASATDDPRITGAQVRFTRNTTNVHGIRGARAPFQVTVDYSTYITARGANAVSYTGIKQLWGSTIKPFLLQRARAVFGGTPVVYSEVGPNIDPHSSTLKASMVLFMLGSGSNVYSYSRQTSMNWDFAKQFQKIHDGKGHTYTKYSSGDQLVGQVVVTVSQIDEPGRYSRGNAGFELQLGGVSLNTQGALTVSFQDPNNNNDNSASDDSYQFFPTPGDPRIMFPDFVANGRWEVLNMAGQQAPQFWGQDVDNQGSTMKITGCVFASAYRYVSEVEEQAVKPPKLPRPTTGSNGGSGTQGTTTKGREGEPVEGG